MMSRETGYSRIDFRYTAVDIGLKVMMAFGIVAETGILVGLIEDRPLSERVVAVLIAGAAVVGGLICEMNLEKEASRNNIRLSVGELLTPPGEDAGGE